MHKNLNDLCYTIYVFTAECTQIEGEIISNLSTTVMMRHLQGNHPNQIFVSASSDDISLPETVEWQLSGACTER